MLLLILQVAVKRSQLLNMFITTSDVSTVLARYVSVNTFIKNTVVHCCLKMCEHFRS